MAEIFTAVLEVVKLFVSPIQREFSYLCNHKSNIESLKSEFQKLTDASLDVQRKTVDAERSGDKIKQNVKRWQDDVNKFIDEAGQSIEENTDAKNRCFKGMCPNLIACYIKSKEASRNLKIVSEHLKEGEKFNEVSYTTKPEEIWLKFNEDFEDFESRKSSLKDILNAVKDENVDMIGVYGMGGAGKTTLAQEVGRQAQKAKRFEEVVFVEVSDAPDIYKIQENIAGQLDLKFVSNADTSQRANKLYERLLNKKFLMIFDNIWEEVDLKTVGIPAPAYHKGSKLLLTTRDLEVLKRMRCKSFHLDFLSKEESWRLFKSMAGDYIEKDSELKRIADDVVKECGGLPIALVTVGKALMKKKICQWKNALRELRRPPPMSIKGSVLEAVYSKINLSYNFLESEELKGIFLLCSLIEYDASVFDLFKYVIGLDILGDIRTLEEARNRLDSLVQRLKDSCLLLDSRQNTGFRFCDSINSSERFSMHDVVRAVAITIARREQNVFMGRNDSPRQWPGKECTKICMVNCNFGEPSEGLECPKLEFFYVRNKDYSSFKIPANFFTGVANLKVLDIPRMELLSSPLSLHLPVNLQTLCLENSRFEDIAVIGELKQLKILSFRDSYEITQLPVEIGELTQLRLLDLTRCQRLKVIAPNVISRLIRLEELYMRGCGVEWEVEELNVERSNVRLDELKHLSNLTTLEINIKDQKILPNGLFSTQLERFYISVGKIYPHSGQYPDVILRKLYLNLNSIICPEEFQILKNVEFLYLDKFPGVNNVLYSLNGEGFPQLKQLVVRGNPDILCIVDSTEIVARDAFPLPLLESLSLDGVINLEKVCHGLLTVDSLCNLRDIVVTNCDKLKNIFSFSDAKCLPVLERITVGPCKNMKEIFVIGGEDNFVNNFDKIEFRKLRFLSLRDLPELTSFYSELMATSTSQKRPELTTELQSSDIVLEEELETPTALFNTKVVFPSLEDLSLRRINSEKIWHSSVSTTSSNYHNLTKLSVVGCEKLQYVFPASIIKSFVQLQNLEISGCIALTEIVGKEGGDEAAAATVFDFPRVNHLTLSDLPKLESFFPGIHTSKWLDLKKLVVVGCSNVMIFTSKNLNSHEMNEEGQGNISTPQSLFFIEEVRFPNLEDLYLEEINSEKIWHNFLSTTSPNYQNLAKLAVVSCEKLKYVFPASIIKSFVQLQKLEIRDCIALTEIVGKEGGDGAAAATTFDFPRANHLILDRLPKLESFYPGKHTSKWPELKKLEVRGCNNVMVFTSKYLNSHEKNEEDQGNISTPQPLFFIEEINPNVEELTLRAKNAKLMWQWPWQFPEKLLSSGVQIVVEIVEDDESTSIPLDMPKIFYNLQHLKLTRCAYKELFLCGEEEKHVGKLTPIKKLTLSKLFDLEKLWKQDSKLDLVLQNLENLQVFSCHNLITLMPTSASFQNLTALEVYSCRGLMNVVSYSTAKSFEQLRELKISFCQMMIEIVKSEEDEERDAIGFNKLKTLSLQHLGNLTSFCSGNYTINFPSLEDLTVENCPNMKTFTGGFLSTPKLQNENVKLQVYGHEECWDGDLNKAIQKLHQKKVNSDWEELTLSGKEILMIWQGQFPVEHHFERFKVLEVVKDESTRIPLGILQRFNNLEKLILKWASYEEIFSCKECEEHAEMLTKIKVLKLWRLFNLKYIWKEDSQLCSILQNLENLSVNYCHSLMSLVPSSASFENLTTLDVWYCNGLINLVTSSVAKSLVRLKRMEIECCEMMQEIVTSDRDVIKDEIVFSKLEQLVLGHLKNLTSFCSGNYTFKFPTLERVIIENCPKMKTFSRGVSSTSKLQKVQQSWYDSEGCWKGDINTTIQELCKIVV